jgi:hypothetical protein
MAKGGEEEWNLLWKRYLKSLDATEKNTILSALACSKDVNIMQVKCNILNTIRQWS